MLYSFFYFEMWYHLSVQTNLDLSRTYQDKNFFKPTGLYYAKNFDWVRFVFGERTIEEECSLNIFELSFKENINLFKIENVEDLLYFIEKYYIKENFRIDWSTVMEEYDGIHIDNYFNIKYNYPFTIGDTFFLAWDVNGGCIWNLDKINVEKISIPDFNSKMSALSL